MEFRGAMVSARSTFLEKRILSILLLLTQQTSFFYVAAKAVRPSPVYPIDPCGLFTSFEVSGGRSGVDFFVCASDFLKEHGDGLQKLRDFGIHAAYKAGIQRLWHLKRDDLADRLFEEGQERYEALRNWPDATWAATVFFEESFGGAANSNGVYDCGRVFRRDRVLLDPGTFPGFPSDFLSVGSLSEMLAAHSNSVQAEYRNIPDSYFKSAFSYLERQGRWETLTLYDKGSWKNAELCEFQLRLTCAILRQVIPSWNAQNYREKRKKWLAQLAGSTGASAKRASSDATDATNSSDAARSSRRSSSSSGETSDNPIFTAGGPVLDAGGSHPQGVAGDLRRATSFPLRISNQFDFHSLEDSVLQEPRVADSEERLVERLQDVLQESEEILIFRMSGSSFITPHCGRSNSQVNLHLTLEMPPGSHAELQVGDRVLVQKEGGMICFNDGKRHAARFVDERKNVGQEDGVRAVLVIRSTKFEEARERADGGAAGSAGAAADGDL